MADSPLNLSAALVVATHAEPYAALMLLQRMQPFLPHRCKGLGLSEVNKFEGDPATTHADIMSLFDRAIQSAEPAK